MQTVKIGMGQMRVEGGRVERNLDRACGMIAEAAQAGCRIVVLPECMDLGWMHPSVPTLAQPIPGVVTERLAAAARSGGIYVCAGLTERDSASSGPGTDPLPSREGIADAGGVTGNRFYNAAVLISPEGQILCKHRKLNELAIARHLYSPGDRLSLAQSSLGRIGVSICADNFSDSLIFAHAMARMGAGMILSPSAWAVRPDHDNTKQPYGETWIKPYTVIARLYDIPVIGVSNVGWIEGGAWDGWKCIGCSLAVGPDGRIITQGPYGHDAEELLMVTVEYGIRQKSWSSEIAAKAKARGYVGP